MDDFADLVHFDSDDEEYLIKAAEAMPNQTTSEEGQVQVVCSYSPVTKYGKYGNWHT